MGRPTICIGENKGADQLRGNRGKLISAFVFATRIVQFLFYLTPKFQASSLLLCLYRSVCVRPVRKPHCWFSHEAAHIVLFIASIVSSNVQHLLNSLVHTNEPPHRKTNNVVSEQVRHKPACTSTKKS